MKIFNKIKLNKKMKIKNTLIYHLNIIIKNRKILFRSNKSKFKKNKIFHNQTIQFKIMKY